MSYNADDPKQVKKAQKKAEQNKALQLDVIRGVMASPTGRAWIYDWLYGCHIYGNPFIPGQPDVTAFNLGEANQGKKLLMVVQDACPDLYLTMVQEAKSETA